MSDRILEADKIEGPHAWIQWKGTDVCMDVHCACGYQGHVDADFAYYYRCPGCERLWAVGMSVRLHALTDEEAAERTASGLCIVTDNNGPELEG